MGPDPHPTELPHSTYYSNAADDLEAAAEHDPEAWRRVRPFRKPITFVPAGSTPSTFPPRPLGTGATGREVAAEYLQLVGLSPSHSSTTGSRSPSTDSPATCDICNLPILTPSHDHTLAHQSALPHSHPPHHLPRRNVGLKILQESGWDPDSRMGLGVEGQGERYPVKAVEKGDRVGVGGRKWKGVEKKKVPRLGAKEARRREEEGKRVRERVRAELGGRVDWGVLMGEEGL